MATSKREKIELLRRVELFAGLSTRALSLIADRLTEIAFPQGRYIVRQGQVGTGFYLVQDGRARAVRGSQVLADLGPGSFFGELSVLDQLPRMAHVIAAEPTTCLALPSWELTRLLEQQPKIALALLRELTRRLRTVTDRHQD